MGNFKILIVEDEALIAWELRAGLGQAGYQVCGQAASGEKAIELARSEKPDLVTMDIRLLGKMDGIEAAQAIKGFSSASIVFTTGYQDIEQKRRALSLDPVAYLDKPVDWREIDAIIQARLGKSRT